MIESPQAQIPQRHPQVASRVVEGQGVIIYADSGEVNVLNDVGTRIWELIDGKRTVDEIIAVIMNEYAVTGETARADTNAFLQDLVNRQAIVLEV